MADNTQKDGPITFTDLGITDSPATSDTVFGKIRNLKTLSKKEIAFLVVALLNSAVMIGLTIQRLVITDKGEADFTFALMLLINSLFIVYYILSGIFFERPYELFILLMVTVIVWVYLVLNYAISTQGTFKMVRLILASCSSPFIIVLAGLITHGYRESKNLIFRTVGANEDLQDMCSTLFTFHSYLKADLQVSVSMAILILKDGNALDLEDKILLPTLLCISVATFFLGYFCLRLENKVLLLLFALAWFLVPAYDVYLIVHSAKDLQKTGLAETDLGIIWVTFVCAAVSMVLRVVLIFFGFKAFINFGKGLKEKVYNRVQESNPTEVRVSANIQGD